MNKEFIDAYVKSMEQIRKDYKDDPEAAHSKADDLLCTTLKDLGFSALVESYKKVKRWYA